MNFLMRYLLQYDRGIIFSLVLMAIAVYLPFATNPFVFDDTHLFTAHTLANYLQQPFRLHDRFFSYVTLSFIWEFFEDLPMVYRLLNLSIHGINTVLLFQFLSKLSRLSTYSAGPEIAKTRIWFASAVFAVHPICTYAVGYAAQYSTLLATLFTLCMFICFTEGIASKKSRWLLLSVIFYTFAVFSKEHCIAAPIVTLFISLLFKNEGVALKKSICISWFFYIVIAICIVWVISNTKGLIGNSYESDAKLLAPTLNIGLDTTSLHILSILNQAGLFFKYLFLWCFPNPAWLSIDMRESFGSSVSTWQILRALAFVSYGAAAIYLLNYSRNLALLGLGLLYPWAFFFVEFSTIRIQEPFVLYRSYLWLPGLAICLICFPHAFKIRKAAILAMTIILLFFVCSSWDRLWSMSSSYRLWNDAAKLITPDTSGAARIYYNRGKALLEQKEWSRSVSDFQRVIHTNPENYQAHTNIGIAYYSLSLTDKAIEHFRNAQRIKSDYALAYFGEAMSLMKAKQRIAAEAAFKQACDLRHQASCALLTYIQNNLAK